MLRFFLTDSLCTNYNFCNLSDAKMYILIVIILSVLGWRLASRLIEDFKPVLINANMYGVDQCKRKQDQKKMYVLTFPY